MTPDAYGIQLAAIGASTAISLGASWADVERLWFEPNPDSDGAVEREFIASYAKCGLMRRHFGAEAVRYIALELSRRQAEAVG